MGIAAFFRKLFGRKEQELTLLPDDNEADGKTSDGHAPFEDTSAAAAPETAGTGPEAAPETAGAGPEVMPVIAAEKDDPDADPGYYNPLLGMEAPEKTPYHKGGSIRLRDVVCAPASRTDRLDGVSLEVKAGESVAFTGSPDSGAWLIPGLILHAFEAGEGSVEVDGMNVRDYRMSALRERMLYIPSPDRDARPDLQGVEILVADAVNCAPPEAFGAFLEDLRGRLPQLTVLIFAENSAYAAAADREIHFENGHTEECL